MIKTQNWRSLIPHAGMFGPPFEGCSSCAFLSDRNLCDNVEKQIGEKEALKLGEQTYFEFWKAIKITVDTHECCVFFSSKVLGGEND